METQPRKIFIVDDDQFLVNMYSLKFTKNGYEVTSAGGAAEALTKLRDGYTPDIIMLDIVMPVMDGLELLRVIRKESLASSAMFIVLSNQGQTSDIGKAKELGVAGYIVKASTIPSEVVKQVADMFDKRKK